MVTYDEIMRRLALREGRAYRAIHIPMRLLKWVTPILQTIPSFPLSQDQLIMLQEGNVCTDSARVYQDLGLGHDPFPSELISAK